jgi:hypothetical protein
VSDVQTFWFGHRDGIYTEDAWSQVQAESFTGGNSAIAFSWQGVEIDGGTRVARSFVVKFGELETSRLVLALTFPRPQGLVYAQAPLVIDGLVEAEPLPSGLGIRLVLVVDGRDNETVVLEKTYWLEAPFTLLLVPAEVGLVDGLHEFVFYAVDEDGDVSDGEGLNVTLSKDPFPSLARTPSDVAAASGGAVAGIVVGSILGVGVVGAAVAGFFCWWKRPKDDEAFGCMIDNTQDV